jgi:hypothetical protein
MAHYADLNSWNVDKFSIFATLTNPDNLTPCVQNEQYVKDQLRERMKKSSTVLVTTDFRQQQLSPPGQISFGFFKHSKGKSLFHHAMFRLLLHIPSSYTMSSPGTSRTSRDVRLEEGRENANIDAGLGFIWRISA